MDPSATKTTSREKARQLLVYESEECYTPVTGDTAVQVCDRLRLTLSTLMGHAAFRSHLERALTLAKREDGSFEDVKIRDNGSLEGLDGVADGTGLAVVASLVALLITFLGQELTVRLLHDVWPALAGAGSNLKGMDQ